MDPRAAIRKIGIKKRMLNGSRPQSKWPMGSAHSQFNSLSVAGACKNTRIPTAATKHASTLRKAPRSAPTFDRAGSSSAGRPLSARHRVAIKMRVTLIYSIQKGVFRADYPRDKSQIHISYQGIRDKSKANKVRQMYIRDRC